VLLVGPQGSGKTMLAKRIVTILSPLSFEEALECTRIHSISGLLPANAALITPLPFRSPHHSVSDASLIGGVFPIPHKKAALLMLRALLEVASVVTPAD
jgi:magnesium chelatase family protein